MIVYQFQICWALKIKNISCIFKILKHCYCSLHLRKKCIFIFKQHTKCWRKENIQKGGIMKGWDTWVRWTWSTETGVMRNDRWRGDLAFIMTIRTYIDKYISWVCVSEYLIKNNAYICWMSFCVYVLQI